jgi:hypothetical protein
MDRRSLKSIIDIFRYTRNPEKDWKQNESMFEKCSSKNSTEIQQLTVRSRGFWSDEFWNGEVTRLGNDSILIGKIRA